MKLVRILDNVNSLEKNSFLKIIDSIKSSNPKNSKEIDKILSDTSNDCRIQLINATSALNNNFSITNIGFS